MRQFILPEDWDGGPTCLVAGKGAHYVASVLRLGKGDSFPGRDSRGRLCSCAILESGPGRVLLSIRVEDEDSPRPELPRIILAQALPKGAKMDLVVRQATEAGVSTVIPLLAERSIIQDGPSIERGEEGPGPRLGRWERIVKEARQQSGSPVRTEIAPSLSLSALPEALTARGVGPSDPKILFHQAPLAQSSLHGYLTGAPETVVLCVGPEGGFSPREVGYLLSEGFKPLRLAGAILRAETAALYAVASVQIILSERSSWIPKPA